MRRLLFIFALIAVASGLVLSGCEEKKQTEETEKEAEGEGAEGEGEAQDEAGAGEGEETAAEDETEEADEHAEMPAPTRAAAVLTPTEGSEVSGTVMFEKVDEGIVVTANITGLEPGDHGFHVHQWGDCSAPDGTSAGGHFNPHGVDHAGPDAEKRHVGDLGNITANEEGIVAHEHVDKVLAFDGQNSIIGRGLIVHAKADDLESQPTGAAGARKACAVIGIAKPAE